MSNPKKKVAIPTTKKHLVTDSFFGVKVEDPYRWLEDNKKDEVQKWLKAQKAFTDDYLSRFPYREELRKRFRKLFSLDTIGIPISRQGKYFFSERKGDQDMAVLYVQDGLKGKPRVLIDPNTLSKDKTITLVGWNPSRDGKLLGYGLSKSGNDKNNIHIMNVDTGINLEDNIPDDLYPSMSTWLKDGSGFYYTRSPKDVPKGEEKYYRKIYLHKLGDNYLKDELVIDPMVINTSADKQDISWISPSWDQRYMIVGIYFLSEEKQRTELYFFDNQNPDKGFVPIVTGVKGTEFFASIYKNKVYIMNNHKAPNWRLCVVDINNVADGKDAWETLIPEGESVLEGYYLIHNRLFIDFLENVHSVTKEYDLEGNFVGDIELPGLGSSSGLYFEYEGSEIFYEFESFANPPTIFRMDLKNDVTSIFKKMEAGFDTETLETKQDWYESKDGTQIPIFIIHNKGLKLTGDNPTLLYGYGGFNVSLTPSFMKNIVPFLEGGGVYAIANLRGGGEFGQKWHEAGIRKNKQNVFDDFIAAAEWLFEKSYTNSSKLAIKGGSNGGLLVIATMIQRPDLAKAVIAQVPVTDMARYQEFFGGRQWIPDYGSIEEKEMVKYLLGYSPYHNVQDGAEYPAILIITSDGDDRVHPMHSYKMIARLQEANASDNPIFLRVELKAGHSGATAISKAVDQMADTWTFIFDQLGIS